MDQNCQNNVLTVTQEPLSLLKFKHYFRVPWTIYYKMHHITFQKVLIILRQSTKHAHFWLGVQYPLKLIYFVFFCCLSIRLTYGW